MDFRVGLFAVRAAKAAKAITMFTKALTENIASRASNCLNVFCCALHTFYNTAYDSCLFNAKSAYASMLFSLCFEWIRWDRMRMFATAPITKSSSLIQFAGRRASNTRPRILSLDQ